MNFSNVLAFGLRCGAAVSKLLFVVYLGYHSEETLLGQFAIFSTIAIVFTQLAGLEVNQTIARKLHAISESEREYLFAQQATASVIFYVVLSASLIAIYPNLLSEFWIVGIIVLCFEHYTTELYRYYTIKLNPLKASVLMFIKNFGWVLSFIILYELQYIAANLNNVLMNWFAFLLLATAIGSPPVSSIKIARHKLETTQWLKRTCALVWSSRFFMLSALAIAGIGAVDKILIAKHFTLEQLGNYYFLQTIASIPALIIGFSLGTTLWPKCIQLASTGKEQEYKALWKKMNLLFALTAITLSIIISIAIPSILTYSGRTTDDLNLFYILIASSAAFVLCDPQKLHLYTNKNDTALLTGNTLQLLIVVSFAAIGLRFNEIVLIATAIFIAHATSLLLFYLKIPTKIAAVITNT